MHVPPSRPPPLSARESRGRSTPGGTTSSKLINNNVIASVDRILSRQGSEYQYDGDATSVATSGRYGQPLSPRGVVVSDHFGESQQPMTKKEFEKARKRKEAEVKHHKLEEIRQNDLSHMRDMAARKQRVRDQRCEDMLDSILSSSGLRVEADAIVDEYEEKIRKRNKTIYTDWDNEVAQRMDYAVMKFMNHDLPPLPEHFKGRELLHPRDDPMKKIIKTADAEEGFKKAAEIILTPRDGSLKEELARREFIDDNVGKREKCRPMLAVPMWEQRKHYASNLGYFVQSCERGGPHHSARRMGEGRHMVNESDGVVAAGKTKNRFEKNRMEMLVGTHAKEGQAKNYKRGDGHSCGAPCQDHYTYERGNEIVDREFPVGKRMYPMVQA